MGTAPPPDIYTHHISTPTGLDFAKAAALYGLAHERVGDLSGFRTALERSLAAPSSTIVEARTDAARTSSFIAGVELSGRRSQPASSGSSACSLISVSASSRAGIGVAHDAVAGVAASDVAAQQRAAQGDAELAVAGGVGPADGPGVPAAVQALQRGDQLECAARRGSPPTAGVGCISPASSIASIGRGQLGADRGRQMLDVGDPHERRLGRGGHPDRVAVAACARSAARRSRAPRGSSRRASVARRDGRRRRGRRCAVWSPRARSC